MAVLSTVRVPTTRMKRERASPRSPKAFASIRRAWWASATCHARGGPSSTSGCCCGESCTNAR
eukprot:4544787-Lingulodinium_polyedra.AAC.1